MFVHKGFALILLVNLVLSQVSNSPGSADVLNRPVALADFNGTSTDAVALLLAEAGVSGEVVSIYDQCDQPPARVFSLPGNTTLKQGLDYVSTVDSSLKWIYRDGVVVASSHPPEKTILNTKLEETFIRPTDSLSLSTQRLLESVEVKNSIKKRALVELNTPLGLSSVSSNTAPVTPSSSATQPIQLRGKTLEQALNILASSKGRAVWHYEQFVCGQKNSFRITWIAQ